jgi:hypothetical protein
VFQMDVAKVDRDVAHVVVVIHVRCKHLFQMVHMFFQMYVACVFLWLHMFHTYVAIVLCGCCIYFAMTFSSVFMCFFKCFGLIFQVFHLSSNTCYKCFI